MADVFSTISSGVGSNLVTMAYDKLVEINLRAIPQFRAAADKKVGNPTHDGSSIRFQIFNDIADTTIAGATLSETTDPDAVALPATSTVDVSQVELGRVVIPTRKLSLMSLTDVDPWVANAVSFNMAKTLDNGVAAVLDGGSNVIRLSGGTKALSYSYEGVGTAAAKTAIQAADTMSGNAVRNAVTKLRAANVHPKYGAQYISYIHPEVAADLRTETGSNTWRTPHDYQDLTALQAGETGSWEGVRFIETPNMTNTQSGSGTGGTQTRVYNTYIMGAQALAEAVWKEPGIEFGNVVDKLNRFRPVGWHGILNWSIFRTPALVRIETAASGRPNA
jgi:N4-gp56 family major capsid protein